MSVYKKSWQKSYYVRSNKQEKEVIGNGNEQTESEQLG